jgi:RND superfamily putative drug exporter
MKKDGFYRCGEFIYRCRWMIIVLWICVILGCIPFVPKLMDPFTAIGFTDPHSQSAKANDILNKKLGFSYNRFIILYHSKTLLATQPAFSHEVKKSLIGLKDFSIKHQVIYPDLNNKQISADQHTAYAVVLFKSDQEVDHDQLETFKSKIKQPANLSMQIGGEPVFLDDIKAQTEIDLYKAEYISTPVAVVTMLVVFGSVVAACLPVLLGGVCALIILMTLYCVGNVITLSVFTLNIALLLGLCLSLDYALLIVNRYRDELHGGRNVKEAIAATQATAGKSVFFSGLAVLASLSALLLFPINVLFSVGVGGIVAVIVSIAVANILLPAVLAVLNHRLNWLQIRALKPASEKHITYWHRIVTKVVKHPLSYFVTILVVLLCLGYPFLDAKFGFSDFRILPKTQGSRQLFDSFKAEFGESRLAPILAIVSTSDSRILTKNNINTLYDYTSKILHDSRVDSVMSIVTTDPRLSKKQYAAQLAAPTQYINPALKELITNTTQDDVTLLTILSKYPDDSKETKGLIRDLRMSEPGNNLKVDLTGTNVTSMDALKSISLTFPYAFLWIVSFTYLVLLISLRSLFLPLKAILTAMLSLFTSFGVLTMIIQQGYFHEILNFEPQGMLDISLLIIIFCALFGISMDYEVFLLTRIKEYYEKTGDNLKSIVMGIDRSCRIISSAAIIVVFICFSFMSAQILIVKAFGLGIAVAVFVDAFIIRIMLVPATMALMGKWNWYLPAWLAQRLPKVSFDPEG